MAYRKLFVGVATLMAPWAAQAQPGPVTLYGVVDLSLAGFSTQERGTALNMQSGVQSGSRWGLRGSEDLGNGLRANFQLESGILANNGKSAQGGRLFGRAAWVGVSGGFGDLRLGRQTSASSATLADFDAFLASYLITGAQTALLPYNANRADNTVAYWSPSAGGLRAGADVSLDYDGGGGFQTASTNKLYSAALIYEQPGFAVTATYEGARWADGTVQSSAMARAGGARQPDAYTLAGRATLDAFTLYAGWSVMRNGSTIPAVQSPGQRAYFPGGTVHGVMAGAAWRSGASTVMASWQGSLPGGGALKRDGATHTQQIYSVGYVHDLSKRTNLYAIYGYMRGAWDDPSWHQSQYAVGMRHRY
ncbi:porin [Achromobacter deleyi]|uniref:porin n=1 Tax=Achromobacter deleyi TaxID=1353891 RepID=UPI001492A9B1|nr:porin [Achromobacter deleyi]QVQ28381.1 porin [Achromobacter deleyi]UIP18484.1 porin [Achromobacter deleyi]